MLRLMIDEHPHFICPGESDFLFDHLVISRDGAMRYDLEALAADRYFKASSARLPETDDAASAFASMVGELRGSSDSCLVLILHRGLERLLRIQPNIQILHIVRDPRDVARSAIGMGWAGNVFYGARTWLVTEKEWERVSSGLSDSQVLEFHYEALLRDTEQTLRKVCGFLHEEYTPAMLDFPKNSTYSQVDASLAEQWRVKQTPRELGLIEPLFGDLLTKRGYKPSGHPPISPGLFDRLRLRLDHSYSVWSRRIARYGLRDPILVSICQKIGHPKWARSAQRRMDIITVNHLK